MKKWYIIGNENYIYHHGIKGQKWGSICKKYFRRIKGWRLNQNGFIR